MLSKYLCFISYIEITLFHLFKNYAQNIRTTNKEINVPKEKNKQTASAKDKKNNQKYKNNR
jgi:hypothetical protein